MQEESLPNPRQLCVIKNLSLNTSYSTNVNTHPSYTTLERQLKRAAGYDVWFCRGLPAYRRALPAGLGDNIGHSQKHIATYSSVVTRYLLLLLNIRYSELEWKRAEAKQCAVAFCPAPYLLYIC